MYAWRRKEEGVERISVCGCMPLCSCPMCGSFCRCASVCVLAGWTSASCPAVCAVTQWIPRRQECCFSLATSRLGQRRGDTTWKEVQISVDLQEEKKKNRLAHTITCKRTPIWANTKQKPWLWYKQAAHALEQSRFIDVVVCPLLGWCAEQTRIQHELIITSVWSCLKKSRYTPTLHVPVCLCFVSECQTHHCVFSLHCLFFIYIYISSTPTCLSLLPLPLSPQRSKCKNNTEICHFSPHFYAVVAWMGCQNFLHSHFKLGSLQQDCVGWVVYKCFWKY